VWRWADDKIRFFREWDYEVGNWGTENFISTEKDQNE
jgi:hypothetical protein